VEITDQDVKSVLWRLDESKKKDKSLKKRGEEVQGALLTNLPFLTVRKCEKGYSV
jgi:hypothetical protein